MTTGGAVRVEGWGVYRTHVRVMGIGEGHGAGGWMVFLIVAERALEAMEAGTALAKQAGAVFAESTMSEWLGDVDAFTLSKAQEAARLTSPVPEGRG